MKVPAKAVALTFFSSPSTPVPWPTAAFGDLALQHPVAPDHLPVRRVEEDAHDVTARADLCDPREPEGAALDRKDHERRFGVGFEERNAQRPQPRRRRVAADARRDVEVDALVERAEDRDGAGIVELPRDVAAPDARLLVVLFELFDAPAGDRRSFRSSRTRSSPPRIMRPTRVSQSRVAPADSGTIVSSRPRPPPVCPCTATASTTVTRHAANHIGCFMALPYRPFACATLYGFDDARLKASRTRTVTMIARWT